MTSVRLACLIPLLAGAVSGPSGPTAVAPDPFVQECTIGVAAGRATVDGRPLLWKVRDQPAAPNNEVYYNGSLAHRFVAVVDANGRDASSAWLGVNEHGFAVLNANVEDLANAKAPLANGGFMREALGGCRSVAEFVALLDSTNGGRDTHGNFGVIDSTGAAFMFEVSPDTFWSYDTEADPRGFIVRTNFACHDTAGTGIHGLPGEKRFVRAQNYVGDLAAGDTLSCANLLGHLARDFSDWACRPIEVPCYLLRRAGQPVRPHRHVLQHLQRRTRFAAASSRASRRRPPPRNPPGSARSGCSSASRPAPSPRPTGRSARPPPSRMATRPRPCAIWPPPSAGWSSRRGFIRGWSTPSCCGTAPAAVCGRTCCRRKPRSSRQPRSGWATGAGRRPPGTSSWPSRTRSPSPPTMCCSRPG